MTLNARNLAIALFVLMFGGIVLSMLMGWWAASPDAVASNFTSGEAAGKPNPASLKGMNTLKQVSDQFGVPTEDLIRAFNLPADTDPGKFKLSGLEALNASGVEIGPASVRVFVALYAGLPFDLDGEPAYLPQSASDILKERGNLTPEQLVYLEQYTLYVGGPASQAPADGTATPAVSAHLVRSSTTFTELLNWGLSSTLIQKIMGKPIRDPAAPLGHYCDEVGIDFQAVRDQLQVEVDKLNP